MSFRLRVTLLAALAVAAAIVGTSFVVYYTDRAQLMAQVDDELRASTSFPQIAAFAKSPPFDAVHVERGRILGPKQLILPGSLKAVRVSLLYRAPTGNLPRHVRFTNATLGGVHSRIMTLAGPVGRLTVSTSLLDVDRNLAHLRWMLVLISIGGVGVAAILGLLVSNRAIAPLRRLTETTERIVATGDLSRRTGQRGRDEISRLSTRLDELLASLDASLTAQRQLVADASHELRTPIATLRANVELLADPGSLDSAEREAMLVDVRDELEAMTTLVGELVELARGEETAVAPSEFRLDELVGHAVSRAARRAPGLAFRTRLEPSVVTGVPERVERAVANLLDNASKWSPAGGTVDVSVERGAVEVRDRGPGIAAEDASLVFNRFYRSAAARGMPGAGLGLAIVKQIADAHGGSVAVDNASDGGAILRLQLSPSR